MERMKRGDRVLLKTLSSDAVFEGKLSSISNLCVKIYNVTIRGRDTISSSYPVTLCFYWPEIRKLTLIRNKSSSDEVGGLNFNGNYLENSTKIKLPPDEFDRLKQMTTQFIFIDNFGKEFTDAIEVLSNRYYVAVAGLGNTYQREKPLSLLLMSDFKQIYIFDMVSLVHLKDLKLILESKFITKVVHGGAVLFGCLYHKYDSEIVNVFDTQVVDSVMSKTENNVEVTRNLSECLNYHFDFPLPLLATVMDAMNDKTLQKRPLEKDYIIQASHLVAYLLILKDHFVKKMLKPYSEATEQQYAAYK